MGWAYSRGAKSVIIEVPGFSCETAVALMHAGALKVMATVPPGGEFEMPFAEWSDIAM